MTRRLVALGDSISCGQGVGVDVDPAQTWVGVLAQAMAADLELLAQPGAATREVRDHQLPQALAQPATLATVLSGLNDTVRRSFDPAAVRRDLVSIVASLRSAGMPVLLVRLHDPTALIPAPAVLRRRLLARVAFVNAAVDAARGPGVLVLDLADVAELRARASWAVDRIHPSVQGHRAMAAAGVDTLVAAGFDVRRPAGQPSTARPVTRAAELRWLVRHGVPYLARKAGL